MKQLSISSLITAVVAVLAYLVMAGEPSGKLSNFMLRNPLGWFLDLVLLIVIFLIVFNWVASKDPAYAAARKLERNHPKFFEEMRSVLRSSLRPLGFAESEKQMGFVRESKFSHGEYTLSLWMHGADLEFILSASKSEIRHRQKIPVNDFLVKGHLANPDKFKSESIAKLNEWLKERYR
jgi:hypothetical protein